MIAEYPQRFIIDDKKMDFLSKHFRKNEERSNVFETNINRRTIHSMGN